MNKVGRPLKLLPKEVVTEYLDGATLTALSKRYDVSVHTIKRNLVAYGVTIRRYTTTNIKTLTLEDYKKDKRRLKLWKLYNKGFTMSQLAEMEKVTKQSISQLLYPFTHGSMVKRTRKRRENKSHD